MPGIPASFNAGFARGLAGVLGNQRQEDQLRERDRIQREDRLDAILLQQVVANAESPDDVENWMRANPRYKDRFKGTDGKVFSAILQRTLPQAAAQALGGGVQAQAPATYAQDGLGGLLAPQTPSAPPSTPAPGGAPPVGALGALPAAQPAAVQAQAPAPGQPHPLSKTAAIMRTQAAKDAAVQAGYDAVIAKLKANNTPLTAEQTKYYLTEGQLPRTYGSATGMQSVAGELPDGAPAFGVFDRTTGQYTDPMTGEPIPGFRPRTSTGSRTLGTNIEALSIEMFGKQASRLTAEEMAVVNRALPGYLERLSHARGTGSGQAANETKMAAPLSVDDAAQLQVPVGSAMRDVAGQTPMTPKQQETRQALTTLTTKLPQLESLINSVIPDYGEGIPARARASVEMKYKSAAGDPALTQLRALAKSMAGEVSRVVQGQTGVLSDQDTQRANAILTDTDSWFSDTRAQALAKVAVMKEMIDKINAAIPNPQATGQSAGQPRAAKPAGASPAKSPVSNAAPAAQKINGAWVIP